MTNYKSYKKKKKENSLAFKGGWSRVVARCPKLVVGGP
jgi:hypothetical protein